MKRSPNGFTMIELVIVILIGSILTSVALTSFQGAQNALAVRNAKVMYATAHQRARSRAVEMGETVLFYMDVAGDSTFMWSLSGGGISDVTRYRSELNVDIRSPTGSYMLCMTPRGYADYNCGALSGIGITATDSIVNLQFWLNADSSSLTILPLGQIVGM